ncbi:hypothetical protein TcWFU_004416 [Taenia crassiceps]|uniref:Uncharacterized protein n=1 Tax=Taenia crassiceps TaxID=6207 RepID=A0ABR4Q3W7_9CEST
MPTSFPPLPSTLNLSPSSPSSPPSSFTSPRLPHPRPHPMIATTNPNSSTRRAARHCQCAPHKMIEGGSKTHTLLHNNRKCGDGGPQQDRGMRSLSLLLSLTHSLDEGWSGLQHCWLSQ